MATPKGTVLLLEDEPDSARLIADFLKMEGYAICHAPDGHRALDLLAAHLPELSLAILDVMVPGPDGRAVLQHIRTQTARPNLPVILLTAKDQESDEIQGLRLGADDYITKPASLHLIKARLETLLRRSTPTTSQRMTLGGLSLDPAQHTLRLNGHDIALTLSEFKLLELLMEPLGATRSRQELLAALPHDTDKFVFDRTVDAHIKNLRAKLPTIDELIMTVRGVGYRINPDFVK